MPFNINSAIQHLEGYRSSRSEWFSTAKTNKHKNDQVNACQELLKQLKQSLAECKNEKEREAKCYLSFLESQDGLIKKELSLKEANTLLGVFLWQEREIMHLFLDRKQYKYFEYAYFLMDDRRFSPEANKLGSNGSWSRERLDNYPTSLRNNMAMQAEHDLIRSAAKQKKNPGVVLDDAGAKCYAKISGILAKDNNRNSFWFKNFISDLNRMGGKEIASPILDVYWRVRGPNSSSVGPQQTSYLENELNNDSLNESSLEDLSNKKMRA